MKEKNGFTVVEMLVTVAFFSILIMISISVGRQSIQRADFTATINQFVSDLGFARQLAARENRYAAVVFNSAGTEYSILLQRAISLDPASEGSFSNQKTVDPLGGKPFIQQDNPGFMVNSMGIMRRYPYDPNNSAPVTIVLNFFRKDEVKDTYQYKKTLTIYPSGGVKIEDAN